MLSLKILRTPLLRRLYHARVIDHYENPRNIGSLDADDKNVGTGLVGAPACIHEDTMIADFDIRRHVSVKDLYVENKIFPVWSYNIKNDIYEIKNAIVIKHDVKKPMKKITLVDDSFIICTGDHKFLLKNYNYVEVETIGKNEPLVSFNINSSTNILYRPSNTNGVKRIEDLEGEFDCYDLQVEENNNFAIITKETDHIQNGIIIKNCGDVMKIQVEVDDKGVVIDAKFKTFGCGSAISASSLGTEWVKGKTIDECLDISNKEIANYLKLPPVKLHCSMLMEDGIRAAIRDYKQKNIQI